MPLNQAAPAEGPQLPVQFNVNPTDQPDPMDQRVLALEIKVDMMQKQIDNLTEALTAIAAKVGIS
jgi:hypothetical protein